MASDLTPAELSELRRLLDAATPGITLPVRVQRQPYGFGLVDDGDIEVAWAPSLENAAALAALVNAAPRLIEMASEAREAAAVERERIANVLEADAQILDEATATTFRQLAGWLRAHGQSARGQS